MRAFCSNGLLATKTSPATPPACWPRLGVSDTAGALSPEAPWRLPAEGWLRRGSVEIGVWQSGPGILQTDGYPHDEYCLVLEGHLIITNRSGGREEFDPGDTFVIPKGWAGTWNMPARFKKQYAAFEAADS